MSDLTTFLANNAPAIQATKASPRTYQQTSKIKLSEDQELGLEKITAWFKKKTDPFYVLSGYAGTGKTTLIHFFLREVGRHRVAISAPTHKAVGVLSRVAKVEGKTLHSLLGLRPGIELEKFDHNNPQFVPKVEPKIRLFRLVIIDESSMINSDLFDLIVTQAKANNCLLLFVGDQAQLPPVKEDNSKAFSFENQYTLTKIVRTGQSNPIRFLRDPLRELALGNPNHDLPHHTNIVNGEGFRHITDATEFGALIKKHFSSDEFKEDVTHAKVLAFTNKRVQSFNKLVFGMLYGQEPEWQVLPGTVLMSYDSIYLGQEPLLKNSYEYIVEEVGDEDTNDWGIVGRPCKLIDHDTNAPVWAFIVDSHPDNIQALTYIAHEKITIAKSAAGYQRKQAWTDFYQLKAGNITQVPLTLQGDLIMNKVLDYGYAVTVHKSQGSTFGHVFIDSADIERSKMQWVLKYVAVTRAQKIANVFVG